MDRHLVAVEVRVVRRTNERMQLDCLTFYKDRLERLDTKSVQRGGTVQHNRVLFDDFLEHIPYLRLESLYHLLCILYIVSCTVCHKFFHNKRLEQLDRHLFRKTALINLQLRSDDDNGTSGIVDTFSEQVLTETSGFTFQHVGQRFQSSVSRACDRTAAASVVDQRVHRLLEHTLLVAHDDIRRAQLKQSLQTVISVDNSSVKIV